jgi:hypothetical protein
MLFWYISVMCLSSALFQGLLNFEDENIKFLRNVEFILLRDSASYARGTDPHVSPLRIRGKDINKENWPENID